MPMTDRCRHAWSSCTPDREDETVGFRHPSARTRKEE